MGDAVALLDGIVAREDVLGGVVAKWQVKGVKSERLLKNTPLTHEFVSRWTCGCAFALVCGGFAGNGRGLRHRTPAGRDWPWDASQCQS